MGLKDRLISFSEWVFSNLLVLGHVKSYVVPSLLIAIIPSFLYEFISCLFIQAGIGANYLPTTCSHIIGDQLITNATTFSFSLTAFLLVAVTVVFMIGKQISSGPSDEDGPNGSDNDYPDGGDRFIVIRSRSNRSTEDYIDTFEFIDTVPIEYEEGEEQQGNGPTWGLLGYTNDDVFFVEEVDSPNLLQLGPGEYYLWSDDDIAENEKRDLPGVKWSTYPRFRDGEHFLLKTFAAPLPFPDLPIGDDDDSDEDDPTIQEYGNILKRSLAYSISASLLGIIIISFSPPPQIVGFEIGFLWRTFPLIYSIATHTFSIIFLGMLWTSIDLIDLMASTKYQV